jgi:hypothetical protein
MRSGQGYFEYLSIIVKRALEGKMGPFNFLVILGFFSSLVLLYISLHVHLDGISSRIEESTRRRQALEDERVTLLSIRNELVSADRIIPLALSAGMRPGAPDQIHRVALCGPDQPGDRDKARWALRGGQGGLPSAAGAVPESR